MSTQPLYNIPRGSLLQMDGRELRVSLLEESGYEVICEDTGECFSLSHCQVETAIRARDCEVINPVDQRKRKELLEYTGGFERLEQFPAEMQHTIRARLALVLAQIELLEADVKLTQRSMSKKGQHRRLLLERADRFAPEFNFLETKRGGKLTTGFIVPQGRTLAEYRDV